MLIYYFESNFSILNNSSTVNATTPPRLCENALYVINNNCIIYVPSGCITAYKTAWSDYVNLIQTIS